MIAIGVCSMKGGVGKTSVTANLACAVAKRWSAGKVMVVDLDPQNAAMWHLGVGNPAAPGICAKAVVSRSWRGIGLRSPWHVTCFPYGDVSESQRRQFEQRLASQSDWLGKQLSALAGGNDIVFIDTPPGPSPYLQQVARHVDLMLTVLLPDGGSFATVGAMRALAAEHSSLDSGPAVCYLVNQLDLSDALASDVCAVLREQLGEALAPVAIHLDESVREALAFQKPVLDYDPHGQASHDLDKLSRWLVRELGR